MAQSVGAVALDIVAGKNTLNSAIKGAMGEAESVANGSSGKISTALGKIGSVASAVGKTVAVGVGVASTAVVAMGKSAISAYADYEQLVGGVETLFKDSAKTVIENASKAYTTAGMSANEYMSTVTSFSASLLQSLGGDTVKASEKADMAITDMSDNANKMGTSMEMIQNAYQGFAKQNYTMLDNLKLGYGGTKEEMQRLLVDAEKISGIKYDVSSYADIVDAIHVVQNEMGITGTTAKEASSTISGSLSSMKGAWQNLLTGMADDGANFGALIDQFVASVETVGANLLPRIEVVLGGVVKLVQGLAPKIIAKIPELVSQLLPSIITASVSLVQAIVTIIPDLVDAIVQQIPAFIQGLVQIIDALIQALPTVVQSLVQALPTLLPALISGIIQLIISLCQVIPQIIQPIIDNLPNIIISIIQALMDNLPALIQGLISLIMGIVQAIPQIIQALVDALPTIISAIVSGLLNCLPQLIGGLLQVTWEITKSLPQIFSSLNEGVINTCLGIWDGIKNVFAPVIGWFGEKWNAVKDAMIKPIQKAGDLIKGVIDKIKGFFSGMKLSFPNIKLPHFGISPKGWKIGDLLEGSIPKLDISWYSKAMNNPMIMTKPTIFGYDAGAGKLLGGGEAGSELVVGTNTLLNMIKSAVAGVLGGSRMTIDIPALQNVRAGGSGSDAGLGEKIDRLIEIIKQFMESGNSDMTLPIYIGNELIDEYILNKNNRNVLRSGGRA